MPADGSTASFAAHFGMALAPSRPLPPHRTNTLRLTHQLPKWSILAPLAACVLLGLSFTDIWSSLGLGWDAVLAAGLAAGILAAVFHAEVVAHKVGEPYGTLVLAIAVTAIEVALIVSLTQAAAPRGWRETPCSPP